jgi:hypothetical protein
MQQPKARPIDTSEHGDWAAHTEYWDNAILRTTLARALTS